MDREHLTTFVVPSELPTLYVSAPEPKKNLKDFVDESE